MLLEKSVEDGADGVLQREFLQPSDEFTPIPFWFWNDELKESELLRQIQDFKDKGVMGFVIHPRLGLPETIPYMSEIYLQMVETAVREAEKQEMVVFLYDEAMYPSGSAMGMVVKANPAYASKGLKMTELRCGNEPIYTLPSCSLPLEGVEAEVEGAGDICVSAQAIVKTAAGKIDIKQTILLDIEAGTEAGAGASGIVVRFVPPDDQDWSVVFFSEVFSMGTIRGVHFGQDDGEAGAPPAADLLNPQATETFIRLTHEKYYERLKPYFGSVIKAMFTDEPNMLGRGALPSLQPWTNGFLTYVQSFGFREAELPVLWLEAVEETDAIRRAYSKAVNSKLTESYYRPLSRWCEEHGVQLTGHPGGSGDIGLLEHFQLPGQDVVWRYIEPAEGKMLDGPHSTMAKCASDSARHRGRRRNANECFGACGKNNIGWNFSPDEMKWYMDWLFVRGTNLLIPHAFYYSILGERKNERPPDVGPNSPWWPHYKEISNYIKRMSWLMTDGVNVTPIAVLCEEDFLPWQIVKPLYENQIEFNYLEEALFVSSCQLRGGSIEIARQSYSVIVVEAPERYSEETHAKLQEFSNQGGKVIVWRTEGNASNNSSTSSTSHDSNSSNSLNDSNISPLKKAVEITSVEEVIAAVDQCVKCDVRLQPSAGFLRVSHIRKGDRHWYLLVNEGEESYEGMMDLAVCGRVEKWSPWHASIEKQSISNMDADSVSFPIRLDRRESVIYYVNPDQQPVLEDQSEAGEQRPIKGTEHQGLLLELKEGWTAVAAALTGAQSVQSATLKSWTEWKGMEHFSGSVVYETTFDLTDLELELESEFESEFEIEVESESESESAHKPGCQIRLDLGEVQEIAEIFVNDVYIGTRMWSPYQISIMAEVLHRGSNKLSLRVTNSLANAYNQALLPSGLMGPVTITSIPFKETNL
ncbi:glycosyl hydrolase [Paenibacillus eucommiae]|uniref:Uncharacterized protein n=1 Tax=Paenibacillus eucommiae TaxID=1355755 RepID=A0ABS4IVS8_9BACL|nr:glycosyl hydrolase [Paenibacillus eucommiae]MBP1991689.1 hypothetical protein [Paenibacillus eucommiae]